MPTKSRKGRKTPATLPKEKAPALSTPFSQALLQYLIDNGVWNVKYWPVADDLVRSLVNVMRLASNGDPSAVVHLEAIEKVLNPGKFELPRTKIAELASRYETNPRLARGWELTKLMSCLTYLVEPVHKDRCSMSDPIRIKDAPDFEPPANPQITKKIVEMLYEYWKPGSTLQSLTIRMYIDYLEREGITDPEATISERSLKRDLQAVREWEKTATDADRWARGICAGAWLGGTVIHWCQYSEGWKVRRKQRTGHKNEQSGL